MLIHRKIRVKAVVTPLFKKKLTEDLQDGIQQLDAEISFIEQRTKKTITELTLKASPQVQAVREQLEWEKKKREEAKNSLLEQHKQVNALQEGAEVVQGEVESPVEIAVGSNWDEEFQREIVIKDGIVIEIR